MLTTPSQNESRMSQSNPESNNTNSPDSDDSIEGTISSHTQSIDSLLSDSDADSETIEAVHGQIGELLDRLLDHFDERIDSKASQELEQKIQANDQRIKQLQEEYVPTVAVERVLLEYGIDPDTTDSIIDDMEAVRDSMEGDSDV